MTATTLRPSRDRGAAHHGWLEARHTFSFADYHDADHMSYRALRVINEDRVAPGGGFGMHPHRDMEIVTYVVDGALGHRDSLGHAGTVRSGEVQAMSAGTGVRHSEVNADPAAPVHLLQIWIEPDRRGHTPRYADWRPTTPPRPMALVASPDGADGSCAIHADARVWVGRLPAGETTTVAASPTRGYWIQLISGSLRANGAALEAGDGLAIEQATALELAPTADAHFLLFDLA